ncbi:MULTISPECIES: Na+/H+ antiporter subunit E [Crystallibacter]|uniref:Na+/H+ antiporter subunit E n=1 Tax=Crystallibacter TaxID=3456524 RepID=UPI001474C7EB|nr:MULTISPECIES: Na+/H+ antiporter subunit E [unclassified Arthrobacter]MCW2133838.1 multisubunit sodium/proton antiporter, MrpE subunit [Arthrobacter sp. VKM Ac-2550]NMR29729.1 Na+/H+ antiporter subunit E [Arthrobacter sp. SF27]
MTRSRIPLLVEVPLLVWLVILWGALWQDFSAGNLIFGLLIALAVVNIFYLPPVELAGRLNLWAAAVFVAAFLLNVAKASFEVFWIALTRGPRTKNGVLAVKLRSHSDLLVTATGHTISLIPGSLVVDVDRSTSTLYLHVLDIPDPDKADRFREQVRRIEAGLIRAIGSKEEVAMVKAEAANRRNGGTS